MKIGILSDTHDNLPAIDRAFDVLDRAAVEAVIHGGDFVAPFALKLILKRVAGRPFAAVYGNNDGERAGLAKLWPDLTDGPLSVEMGGRKICIIHFLGDLSDEAEQAAEVIVSGHTHVEPMAATRQGRLYVNPGECCGWLTGRGRVTVLDTETLSAENLVACEQERPGE